jgi:hypothetical protein
MTLEKRLFTASTDGTVAKPGPWNAIDGPAGRAGEMNGRIHGGSQGNIVRHIWLPAAVSQVGPTAGVGVWRSGMTPQQSYDSLNRILDQQAFMLSANDIFYVSAVVFVLLIAVVWLARPIKSGAAADAAASGAH